MEPALPGNRRGPLRLALLAAAAFVASCAARTPPQTASPPPPAPAAGERAYIVFFEFGRADIGPRGRQVVAEAARNAGADGAAGRRVELQAHADRAGSADHNRRLSQRRAEAVAAELARLGVRRERISVQAHGEGQAFVPTRDGAREGQNRGVWIVIR